MKERFIDYEAEQYLNQEGEFVFTITDYELKDSKKGNPMAVFNCKSEAGSTTIYHALTPNARWSYNALIAACLNLDTAEKKKNFELDYQTIGQELVGKSFIGAVACETYEKPVKIPNSDGTFTNDVVTKESYKIQKYKAC